MSGKLEDNQELHLDVWVKTGSNFMVVSFESDDSAFGDGFEIQTWCDGIKVPEFTANDEIENLKFSCEEEWDKVEFGGEVKCVRRMEKMERASGNEVFKLSEATRKCLAVNGYIPVPESESQSQQLREIMNKYDKGKSDSS